eukprot:1531681-Pleurochrysis_carterae.AAC.1
MTFEQGAHFQESPISWEKVETPRNGSEWYGYRQRSPSGVPHKSQYAQQALSTSNSPKPWKDLGMA